MKRLVVALAIVVAPVVGAQRPDFSGTWVRVVDTAAARPSVATAGDASFRVGDMGSGWGSPLTITQRADSLIVEYVFFGTYDLQPPVRLAYAMGGSESSNNLMIGHATAAQRGRIAWIDSALVVSSLHAGPGDTTIGMRQTLTLDAGSLVITTVRSGVRAGAETTTRAAYTKR